MLMHTLSSKELRKWRAEIGPAEDILVGVPWTWFFLELFAGTAGLTAHVAEQGLKVFHPIDISYGSLYDVSRISTQKVLLSWLVSYSIWYIHMGTPCTIWSIARNNIRNFSKAAARERLGVQLALFTARLARRALAQGTFFSIENPWSSRLWRFPPIQELIADPRCVFVVFDCCTYGSPHKKPTAILINLRALHKLAQRCNGGHQHLSLRGSWRVFRRGRWVLEKKITSVGAYSECLCKAWASIVKQASPSGAGGDGAEQAQLFLQQLREAERWQNVAEVGPSTAVSDTLPVDRHEAEQCIASGVVLGHHSKQEALRIGGPNFQSSYPRARGEEEGSS